jgi:RNA polymerase sigma-70 factor, ECF subfamily
MDFDQHYSEKELIEQAKSDPESFGRLYDKYYQPIFAYILKRVADFELAKDLTSETFFKALKYLPRYRFEGKPFNAWLYKIASSQINDFFRQKARYCEITTEESPEILGRREVYENLILDTELAVEQQLLIKEVLKNLHQLKAVHQEMIVLRFFEEKSLLEISEILNLPVNTVKSHLYRALRKLQKLLAKNDVKIYETSNLKKFGESASDNQV